MSLAEDQALLAAVKTRILAIVQAGVRTKDRTGGAAGTQGTEFLDLRTLRDMQKELEAKIAKASGGSFSIARFQDCDI